MIDPHCHFRDWNQKDKETILHAMEVFSSLGFDSFFDMPNTSPPLVTRKEIERRIEDGKKARSILNKNILYCVYGGLTDSPGQIREMTKAQKDLFPLVCGLKLFCSQSTGNMGVCSLSSQRKVFRTLAEEGYEGVVAVHAEKESLFVPGAGTHALSRPPESEEESVRDQIASAEEFHFKGTLHIAHVSAAGSLDEIERARERGKIRITAGATPHHALLNEESEDSLMKMNPPLRPEKDRRRIWEGIRDGSVDWIESDHAPHSLSDKKKGASGIPAAYGMALLIVRLRESGMTERRLNELFSAAALKTFGIEWESAPVPLFSEDDLSRAAASYPFDPWKGKDARHPL